jgi:uncharacterized protein YcaQ
MIKLTNPQARQFLLLKHGLLGEYIFTGKQGALEFVRQAGCIQFDPIDVCGRNADLVLQSRVKGYKKTMLDELLYKDRILVDYPDKNLAIIPAEDWPYFERYRQAARNNTALYPQMDELTKAALLHIRNHGSVCSDDLDFEGDFYWRSAIHWSGGTNLSRSVLEQLYSSGDLIIHHKKGTRKYYDLLEKHLPAELLNAPDPLPGEQEHIKWRILRRIGAVGLLWNRVSDAFLNIWELNTEKRNEAFRSLLDEGKILEVTVERIRSAMYCRAEDLALIKAVLESPEPKARCELIAPLDNLMWDRKLIKALFGFQYSWEIYTPEANRRYGYYTLPLLFGEGFIGRIETVADRKTGTLIVKNIWYEDGVKQTRKLQAAIQSRLRKFAAFNGCQNVSSV